MKVLLINPKCSGMQLARTGKDSVPLGLLSIASYLKKRGVNINVIDNLVNPNIELPTEVDFIGFTVMSAQIPHALELSKTIKKENPKIKIIWGGCFPTLYPELCAKSEVIDFVVVGDGELAMIDIINKKVKNKIIYGFPLQEIPSLDYSLLSKGAIEQLELAPTLTSRGCNFRCSFCVNSIKKNKWRAMFPEQAIKEIQNAKKTFPNCKIRIWDESFFIGKQRAEQIVKYIINYNLNIKWETTMRCDQAKQIDMELLAKSGFYLASFGAESGSQRILNYLQKDVTVQDIIDSNLICKKYNIIPQFSFIIGVPHETREDMLKTIHLIKKLKTDNPNCQILAIQPYRNYAGSSIYEELKNGNEPNTLEAWAEYMENKWDYIEPKDCSWIDKKNLDLVENAWAYCSFAYADINKILRGSGVKTNILFRILFTIVAKIRWELEIFTFPLEIKLAKKIIS